jgi:hypothetical protein
MPVNLAVLLGLLLLSGCGGSDVRGRLFLLPAEDPAGVEVQLAKGNLVVELQSVGERYYAKLESEAAKTVAEQVEEEQREKAAELEAAKEALREFDLFQPARSVGPVDCMEPAQFEVEEAERRHTEYLATLTPRLSALGITSIDAQRLPADLAALAEKEIAAFVKGRVDEYWRRHVSSQSWIIYHSRGSAWDRLCWKLTNSGHLNIRSVDLYLTYDGKRLPREVARLFWGLPERARFETKNDREQSVFGLGAGEEYEKCYYPVEASPEERARVGKDYDISRLSGSRGGEWRIGAENSALTIGSREEVANEERATSHLEFPQRPLDEVFTVDKVENRAALPASVLLDEIRASATALVLERAKRAPTACQRVIELQADAERLAQTRAALAEGKAVEERRDAIAAAVEKVREDTGKLTPFVGEGERLIADKIVARTTTAKDGTFHFGRAEDGPYTVLASYKRQNAGFYWFVPITVKGETTQDLAAYNMQKGTIRDAVTAYVIAGSKKPSGQ